MDKSPMVCTPENGEEFKARMKEQMPEAWALAVALHKAGLMPALRGARIGPPRTDRVAVQPVLGGDGEKRLIERAWQRKGGKR